MNRRAFLQYTIALAAAASTAHLGIPMDQASADVLPAIPPAWTPTAEEVHEWLQYRKRFVWASSLDFHSMMATAFDNDGGFPSEGESALEHSMFQQAEKAYNDLETDRQGVAPAIGYGYCAGRDNLPRLAPQYTGPSNEGFAWHNGWIVGNNDRLRRVTAA